MFKTAGMSTLTSVFPGWWRFHSETRQSVSIPNTTNIKTAAVSAASGGKKMPRPIGQRIRQACEIVETYGPCGYAVISTETGIVATNASKYCVRAVNLGLMTVEKPGKRGHKNNFAIYTVAPNWREKVGTQKRDKPQPVIHRVTTAINFVFNLGMR